MVNYFRVKNVGLLLAVFLHLSSASNDTEKSPSDSFVVSANYGVESDHSKSNTSQSDESSINFSPGAYQGYEGNTEHSLFVNTDYQRYSKSYLPSAQEEVNHSENLGQGTNQNENPLEDHLRAQSTHYVENAEMLPTPSEWKGHFATSPCSQHETGSPSNSEHFIPYSNYGRPTGPLPYHQNAGNYFDNRPFHINEMAEPSPTLSVDSYWPSRGYELQDIHNAGYNGQNTNPGNMVYGSGNKETQATQWSSIDEKTSNDRAYEIQNSSPPSHRGNNDFNKPNVVELQEIINKIVKGNSKVHQVLKVPAVYEIHLQEEDQPTTDKDDLHSPLSARNLQPFSQESNTHPSQQGRKKRPPRPRPTRRPHRPRSIKTWNLPSKIKYFDNRHGLNEKSTPLSENGKYAHPKPFSSTGSALHRPWHGTNGPNNQNFDRTQSNGAPVYGSVSVPMTPGSTEVTFLDSYSSNLGYKNKFDMSLLSSPGAMPDLSNYYAKKKKVDNENRDFQGNYGEKNAYRRGGMEGSMRNSKKNYRANLRTREKRDFLPLSNLNYIIYVREKSRT